MKREEISSKYKWNLTDVYKNIDEYNEEQAKIETLVNEFISYKGNLTKTPKNLYNALKLKEQIDMIISRLYVYSNMNLHEDTTNALFQQLTGDLSVKITQIDEKMSFFTPELLNASYEKIIDFIESNNKLKRFKFFLDQLFSSKNHILSIKEEELLSRSSNILNSSNEIFSNLNDADLVFEKIIDEEGKKIPLTHGTYYKYITSNNRTVRKRAFKTLYKKYKELNNTLGNIMNSNLQTTNFLYKTRKYKTPLNMYLDQNRIDTSIYYDLIKQVNNNLDKLHKYFDIKKKILKYNKLYMYDLAVNLIEEGNKEYSYEEAKEIVLKSLNSLGEKYINDLNKIFNENWIDVYETRGKRTGAYAWGAYPTHPYILLNYQGKLNDISTLAHELGHALHRYYSNETQDYYYSDNEIFTAEIASTVNEIILKLYLLKKSQDKKQKLNILNEMFDSFKSTIYRQTMFAEFELDIHNKASKGESFTADKLNNIYYELVKKYHGNNVIIDEEIKYEWSRIPHFYTPFYVYQYATGLSIAFVIAYKIFDEDKEMLEKYLEFLHSGSCDYPTNLVEKMGIDINKSINDALQIFDDLMEEFKQLL